jgi:hypothetical protein
MESINLYKELDAVVHERQDKWSVNLVFDISPGKDGSHMVNLCDYIGADCAIPARLKLPKRYNRENYESLRTDLQQAAAEAGFCLVVDSTNPDKSILAFCCSRHKNYRNRAANTTSQHTNDDSSNMIQKENLIPSLFKEGTVSTEFHRKRKQAQKKVKGKKATKKRVASPKARRLLLSRKYSLTTATFAGQSSWLTLEKQALKSRWHGFAKHYAVLFLMDPC